MVLPELLNVGNLVNDAKNFASSGKIDAVSNIARQKVYLYSGKFDEVVHSKVVHGAQAFYSNLGVPSSNIKAEYNILSAHCMPTLNYGNPCVMFGSPYLNKCNYDGAGIILNWILGNLTNAGAANSSNLMSFDQTAYIQSGNGFGATGYVYVPTSCQQGATCIVHVAFHGCMMDAGDIQNDYTSNAGYNTWAESNNIIVLYPQAQQGSNNACFDWWGYTNSNYAFKSGIQMAAVKAMMDDLSAGHLF